MVFETLYARALQLTDSGRPDLALAPTLLIFSLSTLDGGRYSSKRAFFQCPRRHQKLAHSVIPFSQLLCSAKPIHLRQTIPAQACIRRQACSLRLSEAYSLGSFQGVLFSPPLFKSDQISDSGSRVIDGQTFRLLYFTLPLNAASTILTSSLL